MKVRLAISLVVVIILGLLSLVHFIVYQGLVLGFSINDPQTLRIIQILFGILTVSFITSMLIGMKFNNIFTRIFYYISAAWLGCILYFFIASLIYILYLFVGEPSSLVAFGLFAIALGIGVYGLMNAAHIRTKHISISIPGIDKRWLGRTALFLADLHLGQIYGKQFVEKIIHKIQNLNPDVVFIGGDVFDGTSVDVDNVLQPFSQYKPALGIYAVTGNHEEFRDNSHFLKAMKKAGMRVLMDEKVEVEGVDIAGVDYMNTTSAKKFDEVLGKMMQQSQNTNQDAHKKTILLKHVPMHNNVAAEKGISLQLSGHTHKAQVFPFSLLTPIIFQGFDYGLKSLEKLQVLTTSGVGTWGPPIRVGTQSEIVIITFN
jgi:predicted MPP superfamily phosphohydrolase